jgi:hypothetical protein
MVQTQQATIAQLAKQLVTVQQDNHAAATQLVLERTTIAAKLEEHMTTSTQLIMANAAANTELATIAAKLEEHMTTSTQLIMANATANAELVLACSAKNNTTVAQLETQVAKLQKERTVDMTFFVCT